MDVLIRKATEVDFPQVLSLVKGLAEFQQTPEKVLNTVEQMQADQAYFECFVAEDKGAGIVGIAVYFFSYSTWVGKQLFLDDLFVLPAYRGHKIGSKLLNSLFEVARQENCKRVRWQVSHWNKASIAFYEKCGAEICDEEYNCDFSEEVIRNFRL